MGDYEDMIDLPYTKSNARAHMSARDRAAQFAPFSALTGYSDIVDETGRLTSKRASLDEYQIELIDRELQYAADFTNERPLATATYFVPDNKKSGGEYRTLKERIEKIDIYERHIVFSSGDTVPFDELIALCVERSQDK